MTLVLIAAVGVGYVGRMLQEALWPRRTRAARADIARAVARDRRRPRRDVATYACSRAAGPHSIRRAP